MREGCEVHTGDLRVLYEARKAMSGHVLDEGEVTGVYKRPSE